MKFKRNAAINLLLSQFSEDMEMERENAHAYYNSLSDEELYIEAATYRHEYEKEAKADVVDGAPDGLFEGKH